MPMTYRPVSISPLIGTWLFAPHAGTMNVMLQLPAASSVGFCSSVQFDWLNDTRTYKVRPAAFEAWAESVPFLLWAKGHGGNAHLPHPPLAGARAAPPSEFSSPPPAGGWRYRACRAVRPRPPPRTPPAPRWRQWSGCPNRRTAPGSLPRLPPQRRRRGTAGWSPSDAGSDRPDCPPTRCVGMVSRISAWCRFPCLTTGRRPVPGACPLCYLLQHVRVHDR